MAETLIDSRARQEEYCSYLPVVAIIHFVFRQNCLLERFKAICTLGAVRVGQGRTDQSQYIHQYLSLFPV